MFYIPQDYRPYNRKLKDSDHKITKQIFQQTTGIFLFNINAFVVTPAVNILHHRLCCCYSRIQHNTAIEVELALKMQRRKLTPLLRFAYYAPVLFMYISLLGTSLASKEQVTDNIKFKWKGSCLEQDCNIVMLLISDRDTNIV